MRVFYLYEVSCQFINGGHEGHGGQPQEKEEGEKFPEKSDSALCLVNCY